MVDTEELKAGHRKELKALEGEKRGAIKKAKSTSGKKAKARIAELETEYAEKLNQLKERHNQELSDASGNSGNDDAVDEKAELETANDEVDPDQIERERKIEKGRQKRMKQREKEQRRQQEIAVETANAGPAPRDVENEIIQQKLTPLNLMIQDVKADGHCLYRAVATQTGTDYLSTRKLCAEKLLENVDEFSPFCEYSDSAPDFASYVNQVRSSAEWGGHLELRALSIALKRPILIYSAQSVDPLSISEADCDEENPIRLSYHLQYYALGEHYNQVVTKTDE